MIEILQAIFLGIVEGVTEFLPISSTGHLLVAEKLIGYKDTAEIFTVVVQMGAIAAVLWYYRNDLIAKLLGVFKKDQKSMDFLTKWVIATLPAAIAGLALHKVVSDIISVQLVAYMLIIGGVLIYIIEKVHKESELSMQNNNSIPALENISYVQAIKIGLFQILALMPGVSRSGATIMGGLLSGVSRVNATAFSFYLSIPIIIMAGGYQLYKGKDQLGTVSGGGLALLVGTVVAFVASYMAITWLIRYVSRHNFKPFAYYRIVVGLLILLMLK